MRAVWLTPLLVARPSCSCPTGYSTNGTAIGASVCIPCPIGSYTLVPNSVSCAVTTGAQYTNTTGARRFLVCPAGTVASASNTLPGAFPNGNPNASGSTQCVPW